LSFAVIVFGGMLCILSLAWMICSITGIGDGDAEK